MAGIFSLSKRTSSDPMRESAAMTTVYLLEWNRKFEQFLRIKVGELEARVAAQQARLSTKEEAQEREIWSDDLTYLDDIEGEYADTPPDPLELEEAGNLPLPGEPPVVELSSLDHSTPRVTAATDISGESEEELPDYIGMMGAGSAGAAGQDGREPPENALFTEEQMNQPEDSVAVEIDDFGLEPSSPDPDDDFWGIDSDDGPEAVALFSGDEAFSEAVHSEGDEVGISDAEIDLGEVSDAEAYAEDDTAGEESKTLPTDTVGAARVVAEFNEDADADLYSEAAEAGVEAGFVELETSVGEDLDEWPAELPDTAPEDYEWVDSD